MNSMIKPVKKIVTDPFGSIRLAYNMTKQYWSVELVMDGRHFRALANSGKRCLFIDGGSNIGQGFKFFSKYYPPSLFDFELFEPNPNCVRKLKQILADGQYSNARINEVAISTKNEKISFFGTDASEGGELSQGGSINPEHNSKYYRTEDEKSISVQAIDFDRYLIEKSKEYDVIAMKLDIEGAENTLLEHLIETGSIKKLDVLYVEFHSEYLEKPNQIAERKRELQIIKDMRRLGIRYRIWK